MQFSNTSTKDGILEEIDFWVLGSSTTASTDYSANDKTRNVNRGLDRVSDLIRQADNKWEWDDSNNTDLPIATTDLVIDQPDYAIDTSFLEITRVEAKDQGGNYDWLQPIDQQDKRGTALTGFQKTAGVPRFYDKIGNSLFLYPFSSYVSTNGLKIYFKRNVSYFASSDTTKKPGFAEPFHRILSLYAARDYLVANEMQGRLAVVLGEITQMEASILKFYSNRAKDSKSQMRLQSTDYGARELIYGGDSGPSANWS